jgi:hypothetical protein
MSAGEKPSAMPCRAATKPAAQNRAAPVPQAMPTAVADESGGPGVGLDLKPHSVDGKPICAA